MPSSSFWSRIRSGQLVQVLLVYLGASWVLLQVVNELSEALALPDWVSPVAVILLLVGLLIIVATAWVQSHPLVRERARQEEVPDSWELDLGDAARSLSRGRLPHLTWARALAGGAAAFLLLFGFAGIYIVVKDRGESFLPAAAVAETAPHGIAVLPFHVRGEEIQEWREGMMDLLSTGLDGAGGLRTIASPTVLARWAEVVPLQAANPSETVALDVARRTGARWALLGSAVAIGPRVRITGDVHALEEGDRLGQVQAEGPPDSVLALVDRIAVQTLALLSDRDDGSLPRIDIAAVTTSSLPAIKEYLRGENLFRQGEFDEAAAAFESAVREDSLFALSYYRMSQAYGWGESIQSVRAAEALDRANHLIDRLPDRERMIVRAMNAIREGRPEALELARELTTKYPDDPEAFYHLGEAQLHVREALSGWDEAEDSYGRAVELAPRFAPYRIHLVEAAVRYHADSALLAQRLDALERLAPDSRTVHQYRTVQTMAFGDSAAREAAFEDVRTLPVTPELAQIAFGLGNPLLWDRFERFTRETLQRAPPRARPSLQRGLLWSLIFKAGQVEGAIEEASDPGMPEDMVVNLQAVATELGLDVPTAELDAAVRQARRGEVADGEALAVAFRAARVGDDAAYAAALARLRADADSLLAAGDTTAARRGLALARGQEALPLWFAGELQEAARILEEVRPAARDDGIRWTLATIHRDLGNLRESERYFRTFLTWDPDPMAAYELGKIYDALGEREKARRWLEFFVLAWADADPVAQPLVEDAKERLARLRVG
jgi:tetratricopeptide (TPR) repeat protein